MTASCKFGTSSARFKYVDGFRKTDPWKQFETVPEKKQEWNTLLRLAHDSNKCVRISFCPFYEPSIEQIDEAHSTSLSQDQIHIAWTLNNRELQSFLAKEKLREPAKRAFHTTYKN